MIVIDNVTEIIKTSKIKVIQEFEGDYLSILMRTLAQNIRHQMTYITMSIEKIQDTHLKNKKVAEILILKNAV